MKSGFVTIIGRPNAGKSTLLNEIMTRKLAIVSNKPQTTRHRITGILTRDDAQIVFVDTPGIHKPKHRLGEYMNKAASTGLFDADVIYYMVDASVPFGGGEEYILEMLEKTDLPVFLLLNKVDAMTKDEILRSIVAWQERYDFAEIFPLSALKGDNVERLVDFTLRYLEEGPLFYDPDTVTDQPERVLMAELIREKVLRYTGEEIPHSVAVQIEGIERIDGKLYINALILTERNSQKGILIGKGGRKMKEIGSAAREEIEYLLGESIFLELWVKVKEDWRDRPAILEDLGYSEKDLLE